MPLTVPGHRTQKVWGRTNVRAGRTKWFGIPPPLGPSECLVTPIDLSKDSKPVLVLGFVSVEAVISLWLTVIMLQSPERDHGSPSETVEGRDVDDIVMHARLMG